MIVSGHQGSFYEVLELDPSATPQDIEGAYHRLMGEVLNEELVLYTLDNDVDFNARKDRLEKAFETLGDPRRRAEYQEIVMPALRSCEDGPSFEELKWPPGPARQEEPRPPGPWEPPEVSFSTKSAPGEGVSRRPSVVVDLEDLVDVKEVEEPISSASRPESPGRTSMAKRFAKRFRGFRSRGAAAGGGTSESPGESPNVSAEEWTGAALKALRESKGVSLDQIVESTRIGKGVLKAFEQDDFQALPAPVYTAGFLRQYTDVLGLNSDKVVPNYLARVERHRG